MLNSVQRSKVKDACQILKQEIIDALAAGKTMDQILYVMDDYINQNDAPAYKTLAECVDIFYVGDSVIDAAISACANVKSQIDAALEDYTQDQVDQVLSIYLAQDDPDTYKTLSKVIEDEEPSTNHPAIVACQFMEAEVAATIADGKTKDQISQVYNEYFAQDDVDEYKDLTTIVNENYVTPVSGTIDASGQITDAPSKLFEIIVTTAGGAASTINVYDEIVVDATPVTTAIYTIDTVAVSNNRYYKVDIANGLYLELSVGSTAVADVVYAELPVA